MTARSAPDGPPPLEPGTTLLPGYVVVRHIRRGRDLDVYDLWSNERDCHVIGKTVRPDHRAARGIPGRLVREGRLLLRLSHPHIVRAYEVHPAFPSVVILETLHGETLAALSERVERLPAADLAQLGLHLASALAYLHRHDILHLDLKPGNVIVAQGIAKLLDLSVARAPGRAPAGRGTRGYMAPEQARGGELTSATDVWALGSVLFELATGHYACHDDDERSSGSDQAGLEPCIPVPVRTWRKLPRPLGALIDQCLQGEPKDRPSLAEVRAGLQSVLGSAPAGGEPPPS